MTFFANELLARFGKLIEDKGGKITGDDIESVIKAYSNDVESKLVESDEKDSEILDDANSKLELLVSNTEEAVDGIMDAVEKIQETAGSLEDKTASQSIGDSAMKIMELCNFQDLNGQRINNIKVILHNIAGNSRSSKEVVIDARMDADMMNGPTDGAVPSQDDIDKLFGEG